MNDNKLNTYLKFIIFMLTILIIVSLIVLTILFIKKKLSINNKNIKNTFTNVLYKDIKLKDLNFFNNCQPLEIIYKENYIAIYSKKCEIIKIIPIN